jgi:hypothetical protein
MVVHYAYITWSPPRLSPKAALELGKQIASQGCESFIREFRQSLDKPKQQDQHSGVEKTPAKIVLAILGLAVCLVRLLCMSASQWRGLFGLFVMLLSVYYVSAWFAYRRFCKWVDYHIQNYASHVAHGGR